MIACPEARKPTWSGTSPPWTRPLVPPASPPGTDDPVGPPPPGGGPRRRQSSRPGRCARPQPLPYCVDGSADDPDRDGWGWENNRSCVVRGSSADR
ncbi:carbohydrate-binding domain-containing protein [Streptomyces sp. NPDC060049]|uniref:carbohydrate-binding domain-containing protein n=1 Tax=Streptomyces sp. NPDC060049 TaxID=3347046 RepID=UPI003691DC9F